ncbi:hypothetical protein EPYR_02216 [Erwinia pyrifoliae DSM 12163]|nr:hypothetical protein EPYR_02216 [Erwinia pyrifoliae DSM 12163]
MILLVVDDAHNPANALLEAIGDVAAGGFFIYWRLVVWSYHDNKGLGT